MKRKLIFGAIVMLCLFLLGGCGVVNKETNYMEGRIKAVVEACSTGDAEALIELFGENIQVENKELQTEALTFMAALEGEFVSAESRGYSQHDSSSGSDSTPCKTVYSGTCRVETTAGTYIICFTDNARAFSGYEQYQGFQSLGVMTYEVYSTTEGFFAGSYRGIYVVTADNQELVRLMRSAKTPDVLSEQLKTARERFGLSEAEYEGLPADGQRTVIRTEEAFSQMQSKYGINFETDTVFTTDMLGTEITQLFVWPEGGDRLKQRVSLTWNTENLCFDDDYEAVYLRSMTEKVIEDMVSLYVGNTRVLVFSDVQETNLYGTHYASDKIPGNVTADSIVFLEDSVFEQSSYKDTTELETELNKILTANRLEGTFRFVIVEKDRLDEITIDNYHSYNR